MVSARFNPIRQRRSSRWRIALGLALAATTALTACGDDDDSGSPADTTESQPSVPSDTVDSTTTAPSTTVPSQATVASPPDTTGLDDEAQIRAVVEYTDQFFLIVETADDPILPQYLTGPALAKAIELIRQGDAGGFTTTGEVITDIESVTIDGDDADVISCVVQDIATLDADGNEVVPGDETGYRSRTLLVREAGRWKVDAIAVRNDAGEVDTCELDR